MINIFKRDVELDAETKNLLEKYISKAKVYNKEEMERDVSVRIENVSAASDSEIAAALRDVLSFRMEILSVGAIF